MKNEIPEFHFPGKIEQLKDTNVLQWGNVVLDLNTRGFDISLENYAIFRAIRYENNYVKELLGMKDMKEVENYYRETYPPIDGIKLVLPNYILFLDGPNFSKDEEIKKYLSSSTEGDIGISFMADKRLRVCVNGFSYIRFRPSAGIFLDENTRFRCDGRLK